MNRGKNGQKRLLLFLLILTAAVIAGGCTLANPDLQQLKDGDQLTGIFIIYTQDLRNYEMQEGDTLYYQEKKLVRADGSVEQLTDQEIQKLNGDWTLEGKKEADGSYTFGDLDGYYMGYSLIRQMIDGAPSSHTEIHASESIYDTHMAVTANGSEDGSTANENIYALTGTLSIPANGGDQLIYPVYRRADGSVYLTSSSDRTLIADNQYRSGQQTYSMSESYETSLTATGDTERGSKITNSFSLILEPINLLQRADILQMDEQHRLVSRTQLNFSAESGNLVEGDQKLILDEKTDYVIIEEHFKEEDGTLRLQRTIYDWASNGNSANEGEENLMTHTFRRTGENGKIQLIVLNVER
ncbi:hypothetical protein Ami103574_09620 [Aminipila butyrica]|uniref:Uncharacterized protein n=1 Tax=Aminipila butyrica TaxID=433296 RepID=A0A858BXY4_9FIRM|nr:hypothetical protein [Aminipila butyrica]QIB69574.1 hypothetical protein Ami103574_09620 [Aminipila butyrica]